MRVPVSWLAEHLELNEHVSTDQFPDALVRIGHEVEAIDRVGEVTGPLLVGRVAEIEELTEFKKPIRYCTVDVSDDGAQNHIICGASNFAEGDLVVVALPGAVLPGGFEIGARKTYGRVSEGMICSALELGIGEDHDGILVLPTGFAEAGTDARTALGIPDTVVDLEITPDRGYALSVRGLARELACALDLPFGDPAGLEIEEPEEQPWEVEVEDPVGCPRFVLRRVTGIDPTAPTPWWMQQRLMAAGIRSISLAVDVTNYVMLELGQPLHAYDATRMDGPIVVRRAKQGERLTTLDEAERELDPDDVVVTDNSGPIGLAGVMGGGTTEISAGTTDILLEAANWEPASISRTARRHKLPSEAAKRFERGVDPLLPPAALELAVRLLQRLGDAEAAHGRTDVGDPLLPNPVTMAMDLPDRVAGVRYPRGVTVTRLTKIGCRIEVFTAEDGTPMVQATPPSWRPDLTEPADLVEEVLRLEGYDTIPSVLPPAPAGRGLTGEQRRLRSIGRALADDGYVEARPFPFVSQEKLDALGLATDDARTRTVRLLNALDSEADLLATTLLPVLADTMSRNLSRGLRDVGLFTIAPVFIAKTEQPPVPSVGVAQRPSEDQLRALDAALPEQPEHVAVLLTGNRQRAGWWGKGEPASWADAIASAHVVADAIGISLTVRAAEHAPWHPGRCAQLRHGETVVGYAGELHPKVLERLGLPKRTCAMELDLSAIPVADNKINPVISAYPPVLLDVAVVLDETVPAAELAATLREGAGELLEDLALFDVYTGEQLGEGKRSLAFSLRFRAADRTLASEEATAARDAAVQLAGQRHGATLR
ncbi:phenylalanine--tRNA ligase subunit beta [Sciscionella sediminilitoris]|uniref:phenylalanine--tRNA ligase subunit beta n=1 Tax=Sciscionella sediminilitoris TaxID=1445613 RepID=UPI0004DF74BF|nr:phenylalanine--tRNA ligase subunit beta [Sciscionella sp. SE31]